MKISQVKQMADHMLMFRTVETGDRKYYFVAHEAKDYTELYTWGDADAGVVDFDEYKIYVVKSYIPINKEKPEETIYTFWKAYMLQ